MGFGTFNNLAGCGVSLNACVFLPFIRHLFDIFDFWKIGFRMVSNLSAENSNTMLNLSLV